MMNLSNNKIRHSDRMDDRFTKLMFPSHSSKPLNDKQQSNHYDIRDALYSMIDQVNYDELMNHVETFIHTSKEFKPLVKKFTPIIEKFLNKQNNH